MAVYHIRPKLKIVIPRTQSIEKKEILTKLGADLIEVDAVPYSDPKNYIKTSKFIQIKVIPFQILLSSNFQCFFKN